MIKTMFRDIPSWRAIWWTLIATALAVGGGVLITQDHPYLAVLSIGAAVLVALGALDAVADAVEREHAELVDADGEQP